MNTLATTPKALDDMPGKFSRTSDFWCTFDAYLDMQFVTYMDMTTYHKYFPVGKFKYIT